MELGDDVNWEDLKLLLAVAECGTVQRSAERLRVDPTTIPRRLRRLEARLGHPLIERIKGGVVLTAVSESLVQSARRLDSDVRTTLADTALTDDLVGVVKFSATDFVLDLLAPGMASLQAAHPGLMLDLQPTNDFLSIERRETDVAVRFLEQPHEALVGRRLPPLRLGVFASDAWTTTAEGAAWLSWRLPAGVAEIETLIGARDPSARIATRVDSMMIQARLAALGVGKAILPLSYVSSIPERDALTLLEELPPKASWLLTHQELRHIPRVRALIDAVAAAWRTL